MRYYFKRIQGAKSGFTLIELMIVIAIVGILSLIAIPNFIGSRGDSMLKSAARELLGDISRAKMGAIKENKNWSIKFISGGYQIQGQGPTNIIKTVQFSGNKAGVSYSTGSATKKIDNQTFGTPATVITYNNNTLTFNPRGTCNAGYIYLANKKGTAFVIGTLSSGITIFKQWMGSNWSN